MSERYSLKGKRIWVAGHRGMVGAALVRCLQNEGCEILTTSRAETDLTRQSDVERWLGDAKPQTIFMAAAKVGGILANDTYPADFLYQNTMIAANVTASAYANNVEKMLFLGSSCIYPKLAPQPIPESALLTGPLEPTNEWYAIAKIAGIKLCQAYRRQYGADYISAMPSNLYGPGDNYHLQNSHVIPALIRRMYEAKLNGDATLKIWGTGTPKREFLHVDDLANAAVHLMKTYSQAEHINVGSGEDLTILELAHLVAEVVGFSGKIETDPAKPDGAPRKLMDISRLRATGWRPRYGMRDGLENAFSWFKARREENDIRLG